jgi:CRP-like cAMP-binding protein
MALEAEVETLRSVPIFSGLDPRRLKLIAFTSQRVSFKAGDVMFRQGHDSDCAYVVLTGSAEVVIDTPSGPLVVSRIGSHAVVGEMGVITGAPRSATVVALAETTVLRLPKDHFLGLLQEFPQLALAVMRDLAHRLEATNRLLAARSEAGKR